MNGEGDMAGRGEYIEYECEGTGDSLRFAFLGRVFWQEDLLAPAWHLDLYDGTWCEGLSTVKVGIRPMRAFMKVADHDSYLVGNDSDLADYLARADTGDEVKKGTFVAGHHWFKAR